LSLSGVTFAAHRMLIRGVNNFFLLVSVLGLEENAFLFAVGSHIKKSPLSTDEPT
jgi:hypothetical protein